MKSKATNNEQTNWQRYKYSNKDNQQREKQTVEQTIIKQQVEKSDKWKKQTGVSTWSKQQNKTKQTHNETHLQPNQTNKWTSKPTNLHPKFGRNFV